MQRRKGASFSGGSGRPQFGKADLEAGGATTFRSQQRPGIPSSRVSKELLGTDWLCTRTHSWSCAFVSWDEVRCRRRPALETSAFAVAADSSRARTWRTNQVWPRRYDVVWTCGRAVLGRDEVLSVVRTFLQAGATVGEGEAREERAGTFAPLVAGVVGLDAREVGRAADVARAEEASVGVSVVAIVGAGVAALVRAFVQEDLGGLGEAVLDAEVSGDVNGLQSVAVSWHKPGLQ
ncbi:Hypothetical_protein [Hexamita inflata]|uniref:Hypothetical_protein n=1 Tax=Hexamita inflata TaxID=28002 RepID=A0AA86PGR8_9EUKA|nr:Hypothetical protein HINF_LOCUS26870 [Hexamita inflata]